MSIHYEDSTVTLHHGDCLDVLRELPDASVDSVCTDPPYGLEFMGKEWDSFTDPAARFRSATAADDKTAGLTRGSMPDAYRAGAPFQRWCEQWAVECLRVLKPGGHLLAFGGTRTWHRLACAVEDAGFEVRDSIAWLYGSGFPKSLDVSKAIDKAAGAEREVVGTYAVTRNMARNGRTGDEAISPVPVVGATLDITAPATPDAARWQGWGTALKPAFEPVVCARKPLSGTVAATVLAHGTGALNIDGCRVGDEDTRSHANRQPARKWAGGEMSMAEATGSASGRWPANVVLDDTREPVLRLRYNLPVEVERTIRESFGASTDHLPAMRDLGNGVPEQGSASEVLLSRVPSALDVGEPDRRESAEVGQAAHPGDPGADRGDEAGQSEDGREVGHLEGRTLSEQRLRDGEAVEPAAGRAGDVSLDGVAERSLVHPGASAGRGTQPGPTALVDGDRSPSQRDQGRQPARELGAARVERLASDEARRGRRGDVQAPSGERRSAVAPLDVLRRECPPAWWHYFDVVGHKREGQAAALDEQSGERPGATSNSDSGADDRDTYGKGWVGAEKRPGYADTGGASRFFYVAKAPAAERVRVDGIAHPTVKPLALMRWLVRLVTPPGGVVLEPFAGSGTTVEACILEGFHVVAIEREADYLPLIAQRIHRRKNPVEAVRGSLTQEDDDMGLFDLLDTEGPAA